MHKAVRRCKKVFSTFFSFDKIKTKGKLKTECVYQNVKIKNLVFNSANVV